MSIKKFKDFLYKAKDFFTIKCPKCGSKMKENQYIVGVEDSSYWKCSKCGYKDDNQIPKDEIKDSFSSLSDMGAEIDFRIYNVSNIEIFVRFNKKLTFDENEIESELNNSVSILSGMGWKFRTIFVRSYYGDFLKEWDSIDDDYSESVEKKVLDNEHGYFFLETGRHVIVAIFGKYIL